MAECSPLDAFVQLAKAHGLVEETHNITATLVASQAEELLHATQQHADARLHDALAQAQSVYEPLLSEDAVQSQVSWWNRVHARGDTSIDEHQKTGGIAASGA